MTDSMIDIFIKEISGDKKMQQKTKDYKKPVRSVCGVLCADMRTSFNHSLHCEKCKELREFSNNHFYIVTVK